MWLLVSIILQLLSELVGHEGKEAVEHLLRFSHIYSFVFKKFHRSCYHFPVYISPSLTIPPSKPPHHPNHFLAIYPCIQCISITFLEMYVHLQNPCFFRHSHTSVLHHKAPILSILLSRYPGFCIFLLSLNQRKKSTLTRPGFFAYSETFSLCIFQENPSFPTFKHLKNAYAH